MNHQDELRDLWHSQPVDADRKDRVPDFATLAEQTVPIQFPLSRSVRIANVVGITYIAIQFYRDAHASPSGLEIAGTVLAIATLLGTAVWMLAQRDLSREGHPEESVLNYRTALAREYGRQCRLALRGLAAFVVGLVAGIALISAGRILQHGLAAWPLIKPVFVAVVCLVAYFYTRRAWMRGLRRLEREIEDVK